MHHKDTSHTPQRIVEAVTGRKKQSSITLQHLERYLYTFAFEMGCEVPNDTTIDELAQLLTQQIPVQEGIPYERFIETIKVGLALYEQAQKIPLGGIFERMSIMLKQRLYYDRIDPEAKLQNA